MKAFLQKLWEWLKKTAKFIWNDVISFLGKFNYSLKFISKGIKNDNTKDDRVWMIIPTLFTRGVNKSVEIGFVWFGVGFKLIISKK